jgi:hypothetical protein
MALTNIPGFIGYEAKRISSFDGRAIGKFTDTNALYSLHKMAPSEYDRKVISLYTQTALYSNDFLQMINKSDIYYPDSEYWQWKIGVPYRYPTIIEIPSSTVSMLTPGIDGQVFEIVLDRKAFFVHNTITADRRYAPQFYVTEDPVPYNRGWKYKCTLVTQSPMTDYVDASWLSVGVNMQLIGSMIGEFDQEMPGLPEQAQEITLYETMSAGYGAQHKVSKWASQLGMKDEKGNPLDMMVYAAYRLNELGQRQVIGKTWESYIDVLIRKYMLDMKVSSFIWSKPGTAKSQQDRQEVKKSIEGLYWKMRNHGNRVTYNRGDFTINLMRSVYGDLFYRRVDIANRRVKVYTNEAGMEVFNTAAKKDALGSGLTFNVGDNDKFVSGKGQDLMYQMNFSKIWTLDTGTIELIHLKELDQPQTNTEFGQNKKSTPVFLVFDISPEGDGTPKNNVREVRLKGAPSMTWGYINGRQAWQGHAASQGMVSSSMDPATSIWMEDRCDIFVEDLSRMVLIEENPQY